jgi:hypothetical protein
MALPATNGDEGFQRGSDRSRDRYFAFLLRYHVPTPLYVAGFRIVRFKVAGLVGVVATDSGDDVVREDHGRHRAVVEQVQAADSLAPTLAAILHGHGNHIAIRCFIIQPVDSAR